MTLEERLQHARIAQQKLGGSIPWLVDPIDNRFKRALGDRPNSEFIVDPSGKIVRKRAWSDPAAVRQDLENLVGKSDTLTKPEDAGTYDLLAASATPVGKPIARLPRAGLFPLITKTSQDSTESPYYVKVRCEGDLSVIDQGEGSFYLGFHIDSLYSLHWNPLDDAALRFELELPDAVDITPRSGTGSRAVDASDTQPREFLLEVKKWPKEKQIVLTVHYAVCTDTECHVAVQKYRIERSRDIDGGAAPTAAFRGLDKDGLIRLLMKGDKNGDKKLVPAEVNSIHRSRFADFDLDHNGILDSDEIHRIAVESTAQKEL